jgi:dephospho-CoA kinase
MKVGLTGGIGSGKSTIAKIFAILGVPVYDADAAAKNLMQNNPDLKNSLLRHFGKSTYENGSLNRKYLASIVFSNQEKLILLNSLVHPYSIADSEDWAKQQEAPYVIKEAALLFETEAYLHVDYTIGVSAPKELRISRVMQRDQLTREAVLKRIEKQMDEEHKLQRCDFVIKNNEAELIIPQVLHLHRQLTSISNK